MQSTKRGPEMTDIARNYLADELVLLADEFGERRADVAVRQCMRETPFRPDISDIRKILGATQAQREKAATVMATVNAADEWTVLLKHLEKYADRDVHGKWSIRTVVSRNRYENGAPVLVENGRGGRAVAQDHAPVPSLNPQTMWCMGHIGGIARIQECERKYIEVVRKEFLKAWPLYEVEAKTTVDALGGGEDFVGKLLREVIHA